MILNASVQQLLRRASFLCWFVWYDTSPNLHQCANWTAQYLHAIKQPKRCAEVCLTDRPMYSVTSINAVFGKQVGVCRKSEPLYDKRCLGNTSLGFGFIEFTLNPFHLAIRPVLKMWGFGQDSDFQTVPHLTSCKVSAQAKPRSFPLGRPRAYQFYTIFTNAMHNPVSNFSLLWLHMLRNTYGPRQGADIMW